MNRLWPYAWRYPLRGTVLLPKLRWLFICALPVLSPLTFRQVVWQTMPQSVVFVEFRGVVLFVSDYVLAGVLILSALQLLHDVSYREHFYHTASVVFFHYKGIFWVGLCSWMALSTLWAREPVLAAYSTIHVGMSLVMALIVADVVRHENARGILVVFCTGAIIQTAIATAQMFNRGPIGIEALGEITLGDPPYDRGYGLTVNPNNLSGFLATSLFASYALFQQSRNAKYHSRFWSVVSIGCGFVIGIGLLAASSRASILSLIVIVALIWLRYKRVQAGLLTTIRRIVSIIDAVIMIWIGLLLVSGTPSHMFRRRNFYFEETTAVVQSFSWLGTGAGNLMIEIAHLRDGFAELLLPAHNVFLVIRAELGIPGLALFILGCLAILVIPEIDVVEIPVWRYCFVAICVTMLLDYYFWGDHRSSVLLFWVLGMHWGTALSLQPVRACTERSKSSQTTGVPPKNSVKL
jgi:hypothetical protein